MFTDVNLCWQKLVTTPENRASLISMHEDHIFAEVNSAKIFAVSVFFLNILEAQIRS